MRNAPQGLEAFLRAYYHVKSADWPGNRPHELSGCSAEQLALLPDYYVMPLSPPTPSRTGACCSRTRWGTGRSP